MKLIGISVDVLKLTQKKLYKGEKGLYAKLTLELRDEPDKYGNDVSVWEAQSKEERDGKEDRNFLGNGKVLWEGEQKTPEAKDDDLPDFLKD